MKNFLKSMGIVAIILSILAGIIVGVVALENFLLVNHGITIIPYILIVFCWLVLSYIFWSLFY